MLRWLVDGVRGGTGYSSLSPDAGCRSESPPRLSVFRWKPLAGVLGSSGSKAPQQRYCHHLDELDGALDDDLNIAQPHKLPFPLLV